MSDLLLREREQAAVRAIIATESGAGESLPGQGVLLHVARLIGCDAIGVVLCDELGAVVREVAVPRQHVTAGDPAALRLRALLGSRRPGLLELRDASPGREPGPDSLALWVRNGPDHVALLWILRREGTFADRDRALLALVAPALERLLRARPALVMPAPLTVQERRVLQQVAAGLSNAEIASHMSIEPCTVRKHLENTYRKLGVSNRIAAVNVARSAVSATS